MTKSFTLTVNGKTHTVDADPDMPLLYALRDDLGLNNPHFGCGLAQCGACTVHLDGQPTRSCITHHIRRRRRQDHDTRRPWHARKNHIRYRPPISRSRCRNAATASTAGS